MSTVWAQSSYYITTTAGQAGISGNTDGTGNTARFSNPASVAIDGTGNVYVADTYNQTIRKITPAGVVSTLAGLAGSSGSANGTGGTARFNYPSGIAVDSAGNLYVADTFNETIRKITSAGVTTTLAGLAGSIGSTDGTGGTARFNYPSGIAVDSAGNLYVADTFNETIRKITPAGVVSTLAGLAGNIGSTDGTGGNARFLTPYGVTVDSANNVYVADTGNNTIREITQAGVVSTLAGLAVPPVGQPPSYGSTDGTGGAARFGSPFGVAVDGSGNVYVADTGSSTLRKITPAGLVSTLAGTAGSYGSLDGVGANAQFNSPNGVAVDSAGHVYVADTGNCTIRYGVAGTAPQISPQPQNQTVTNGLNASFTVAASGNPAPGYQWQVSTDAGVTWNNLSDNGTYSGSATVTLTVSATTTAMGGNQFRCVASNGVTPNATSNAATLTVIGPPAITTQPANQTVTVGNAATFVIVAKGSPAPGYQWQISTNGGNIWSNLSNNGTYGGATTATLTVSGATATMSGNQFRCVASNSQGNVTSNAATLTVNVPPTITSAGNATFIVGQAGSFVVTATGSPAPTFSAVGLPVWASLDPTTGVLSGTPPNIAGAPFGLTLTATNGVAPDATQSFTLNVQQGGLVVTTQPVNQTVTATYAATFTVAIAGSPAPSIQWQVSTDGGATWSNLSDNATYVGSATTALTVNDTSVAMSTSQFRCVVSNAFGSDNSSPALLTVNVPLMITTIAGVAGVSGNANGPGGIARLNYPFGVAVDGTGNVYVADTYNQTIRKITAAGVVSVLAGQAGSNGSADGTGGAARFGFPQDVAVDGAGNVYVADSGNDTIRKITPAGVVSTLAGLAGSSGNADGTGSAARFNYPSGVAVDSTGNVYVTDEGNCTIRKITPAGVVSTLAGLAGNPGITDGAGGTARFFNPESVTVDSAGNVYVTDSYNQTIRKITPAGVVSTLAGLAGSSGSADGTGGNARFDYPLGVAVDGAGNVYVMDTYNQAIRKITPAGVVSTLAGLAGSLGSADGVGSHAQFNYAGGLAVDSAGNVYVADTYNHTIRKGVPYVPLQIQTQPKDQMVTAGLPATFAVIAIASTAPAYQWQVSTDGAKTWSNLSDNGTYSGSTTATLTITATTVAMYGNQFWCQLSNGVSPNVTSNAATLRVTGPPAITTQPANQSVSVGNSAKFDIVAQGSPPLSYQWQVSTDGGSTWSNVSDDGIYIGSATATLTITATTVAMSGERFRCVVSNTYNGGTSVTSNAATLVVNVPPTITSASGTSFTLGTKGTFTFTATGFPATIAFSAIGLPAWATLVPPNTLPDNPTNFWILTGTPPTITGAPFIVTIIASNGAAPDAMQNFTLDVQPLPIGPPSIISQPASLTTVTATYDAVFSLDAVGTPDPSYQWQVSTDGGITWNNVAANGTGGAAATSTLTITGTTAVMDGYKFRCVVNNVYGNVTSSSATLKVNVPLLITTLAGQVGSYGSADGGATARFNYPFGVAVDSAGNVYVADTDDSTIRKITPLGAVTTLAGLAGVNGSADGPGANARFYYPVGVAVDSAGNLYVADSGNNTIRKITAAGVVSTLAGVAGSSGSTDGTGVNARFNSPAGMAVDSAGNVYVADEGNNTIRKITPAGVVSTLAGLALASGSTDGTGSTARFFNPEGVAVDNAGNLYVTDTYNHTLRKITPAGVVSTLAGLAGVSGSADGAGSNALFEYPLGVGVDNTTGNIYVADEGNDVIRRVTSAGVVSIVAGLVGSQGSTDGVGINALFDDPHGLAVDSAGNVYVADTYNYTIRKSVQIVPPVITSAASAIFTAGQAGSFTVVATGLPVPTYSATGLPSWASLNSATGVLSGTPTSLTSASFTIIITASNGVTSNATQSFTLNVLPVSVGPPSLTTQPANQTVTATYAANFIIVATGSPSPNCQWQFSTDGGVTWNDLSDNATYTGSAAASLTVSGTTVAMSGNQYRCVVGNAYGSVTSSPAVLTVNVPLIITTLAGQAGSSGSADGTGGTARFNFSQGVAVDSAGNVYVADTYNQTIRKITPAGVVSTLAGLAGNSGSAGGTGGTARFNFPQGVAVDGAGNVYVADTHNNTIRKITPAGVVSTLAGLAGSIGSADGTGGAARFNFPQGVAVDGAGNVYVADEGNCTVRKITPAGVVSTLAGLAGSIGSADGTGSAARFFNPESVAVDSTGNVYVADTYNQTIRKITPAGVVSTLAGLAGSSGSADGTGSLAQFYYPLGLAVDGTGNVYVVDTYNQTIRKITPAGVVSTLAGLAGGSGAVDGVGSNAQFNYPSAIAVDGAGNVYVADTDNSTIRKSVPPVPPVITSAASAIFTVGQAGSFTVVATGLPVPTYSATGLPAWASLNSATGVISGTPPSLTGAPFTVIITASNGVTPDATRSFTLNVLPVSVGPPSFTTQPANQAVTATYAATFTVVAIGSPAPNYLWQISTDGGVTWNNLSDNATYTGSATASLTVSGTTVAMSGNQYWCVVGNAYGSVTSSPAVLTVNVPLIITTLTGQTGSSGSADGTGGNAQFNFSQGVAVDSAGNVYVADTYNQTIRKITPAGVVSTLCGLAGNIGSADGTGGNARFSFPQGVAVDSAGNVYVADTHNNTIRKITPAGAVSTLAGLAGSSGSVDGTGGAARFTYPYGVAVDGAGNVYVADEGNCTIRKITPAGVVSTLAGLAGSIGSADGTGSAARFFNPESVAVDSTGNVYVADTYNQTIRKITPAGVVSTLAGLAGSNGSADGTGGLAQFYYPLGLAVDGTGNVYVADTYNQTIRKITPAGVVSTVAGLPGGSGVADGVGSNARFNYPSAIAVDSAGNVYVADTDNSTIRKSVPSVPPVITSAASAIFTVGQAGSFTVVATGLPVPTYSATGLPAWASLNSATGVISGTPPSLTGAPFTIIITASNGVTPDATRSFTLNVLPVSVGPPSFTTQPANQAVTATYDAAFAIVAAGTPNPSFQWQFSTDGGTTWNNVNNNTTASTNALSVTGVDFAMNGYQYRCVVNNSYGNVISSPAVLTINAPWVITTLSGLAGSSGTADGGSTARFNFPFGVAVDGAGNVYVADTDANTIRKITPAGIVSTLAGQAGTTGNTDGTGAVARFNNPVGLAVDSAGNVYVADNGNNTIRKITPAGVVSTLAGLAGTTGSTDGTGTSARFSSPTGVAVDSGGNVYVADEANCTIRKITPAGAVSTLAGLALSPGNIDGSGIYARFYNPEGVAVDSTGNVYVADTYNNTVRKITPAGVVSTLAGLTGASGSTDGAGSSARFDYPIGVAVDGAGNVYVADEGNQTLRMITSAGVVSIMAGKVATTGALDGFGSAALFFDPHGVAVDGAGNVYVADTNNFTIRKATPLVPLQVQPGLPQSQTVAATYPATFTVAAIGNPAPGYQWQISKDGGVTWSNLSDNATYVGSAAASLTVSGTTVAMSGYQYRCVVNNASGISDTSPAAVLTVNVPLLITTLAGLAGNSGSVDDTGTSARLNFPQSVAVDSAGNVYVADTYNQTVRKITPAGAVSPLAGLAGANGSADGTGAGARFDYPQGVAVDSGGNVYVADSGNDTIRKITPAGVVTTLAGLAGSSGSADGTGGGARFNNPSGVAVDGSGNVYVADTYNHTIRMITPAGVVSTLAGLAENPGVAGGSGTDARFDFPNGVAVDGAGNVYVADTYSHTIRKITPSGVVSTLAGTALTSGHADGTGPNALFNYPSGVAVDVAGNIYVADTYNQTIRKITPAGVVSTLAGLPGGGGAADGVGSNAQFNYPSAIAVDGAGNVYVADTDNSTIRKGAPYVPLQIQNQPQSQMVAAGAAATFTVVAIASTAPVYQWQVSTDVGNTWSNLSDNVTNSGSATATLTVNGTTGAMNGNEFRCLLSNADSPNVTSDVATLTVTGPPAVVGQPVGQEVTRGSPATFTIGAKGDPAPGYQWQMSTDGDKTWSNLSDNTTYSGSATAALTISGTDVAMSGNRFRCLVSNGVSPDAISNGATLVVDVPPTITSARSANFTLGVKGTFTVAATGSPALMAYSAIGLPSWATLDSTTGVLTGGPSTIVGSPFTVTITASNGVAPDATQTFTINVLPLPVGPPSITLQPVNQTTTASYDAVFTLEAVGTPDPNFQWQVSTDGGTTWSNVTDNGGAGTAVTATLTVIRPDLAMNGYQFRCVANNSYGNVVSSPAVLTVNAPLVVTTLAGLGGTYGSADGGSTARFNYPFGVAVDATGNVYVADTDDNTIRKITPAGIVSTLAGLAGVNGSTDGTGSSARFNYPAGVAVDSAGNVYVADSGNNTIRKITPAGIVSTLAGLAGSSNGSADGTAAARFNSPAGVAVDAAGNVYVADEGNCTIRKITPAGVVSTLAGLALSPGSADGAGNVARFFNPESVAVDGTGNIYVADTYNQTVRKITPSGAGVVVSTLAGLAGSIGSADGAGSSARFDYPLGVAVDGSGNVYVADESNQTLRKITPAGVVNTLAGKVGNSDGTLYADGVGIDGRFQNPHGVAVDGAGNVYVADTYNFAIRKAVPYVPLQIQPGQPQSQTVTATYPASFTVVASGSPAPGYQWQVSKDGGASWSNLSDDPLTYGGSNTATLTVGNTGLISSSSDFSPTLAMSGYQYRCVVSDASGVRDNSPTAVLTVNSPLVVTTLAGLAANAGFANGTGTAALFNYPAGIAVDSTGNVYVADTYNQAIRKITPAGVVSTLAGLVGNNGSADGTGGSARFYYPSGAAVDGVGNVYVADSGNNTIRKITPAGAVSTLAGLAGSFGSADGTGGSARFNNPTGVAVDGVGNVYVADSGNHTIRKITPAGVTTTLAGLAGNPGNADGAGTIARFDYPHGVAVDSGGNVFVADTYNHTIRKITPAGLVSTLAGGPYLFAAPGSTDGAGANARFYYPSGVAVDGTGNIYVADTYNFSIRKITPAGLVSTLAGWPSHAGYADGSGINAIFGGVAPTYSPPYGPSGIAVDSVGKVYVADTYNHAIRVGVPVVFTPLIQTQPSGQTVTAGQNAVFALVAAGTPTYQWQISTDAGTTWANLNDNGTYSGSATATLTVASATTAMSGNEFQCVVSNGQVPNDTSSAVTLTVTSAASFAQWQTANFGGNAGNAAIAGASADPDHDGLSNLLEYALGSDPLTPSSASLPVSSVTTSPLDSLLHLTLTATLNAGASDLTLIVEVSADLLAWSSGVAYTEVVGDTTTGSVRTLVVRDKTPLGAGVSRFMRLKVIGP